MEPAGGNVMAVVAGIIRKEDKILIAQRKDGCRREPCKWEFPGGKVEPGEMPEESLGREIMEELGIRIRVGKEFCSTSVESWGLRIGLRTFLAEWVEGEAKALGCRDFRWVRIAELAGFDWARADVPVVEKLIGQSKRQEGA